MNCNEEEQAYFDEQTAKMDIFAGSNAEVYACYREFILKALTLLSSEQEFPLAQWLISAGLAARRGVTEVQLVMARESVEEYRLQHLGLNSFVRPIVDPRDALSVLLMFAFEDWPAQPATESKTNIVQAIDEFSALYIEFFGRGRELVQILRECFHTL